MVQNEKLNMGARKPDSVNRKHKDSLFRIAFREKDRLLELYNAINDSDYRDSSELTIYTMEDVIFMGIKNDISFLVGEMLNLYEHQSTKNPNMPVRGLLYFARNYESYIAINNLDIFSDTLQKLPFPQYYVLYNGEKDEEERRVMELKDAFPEINGIEACLNCKATVLNINAGHNSEIMKRSRTLRDYALFVQRIRNNKISGMGLARAVDAAVEDCIREGILRDILLKNSAEVKNMVLGAWGTETHIRKQKEKQEELEQRCSELEEKKDILEREYSELEKEKGELEKEKGELEKEKGELEKEKGELEKEKGELEKKGNKLEKRSEAIDMLTKKLLDAGRIEDLKQSLTNEGYRQRLLEEHHLI